MNETLQSRASDIRDWNESLPGKITLRFVRTPDERSALFGDYLDGLSALAPKVGVSRTEGGPDEMPSIRLRESWTFHMVPEAKELDPFLGLLRAAAGADASGVSEEVKEKLHEIEEPSLFDIFVSTRCPNCPAVMDRLSRFPLVNPLIHMRVIDGLLFHERALEKSVRAVPTLFLADGQRFTGQVRPEEVADGLVRGDPSRMSSEAFARMIRAGDAGGLAEMMIGRGQVFPGVVELLAGEDFSLRLGAMVTIEEVAEASPRLALEALEHMWARMDGSPVSVRGDIVYLIGEFGDGSWILRLESLLIREPSPEVLEALEEALSNLRRKTDNNR